MKIYSAQLKGTTTVATGSNVSLTGSFSGSIAGIDINATNQFTASTSTRLTNIEIVSASNINRITSLETKSASVDISISNINSVTASNIARLSNLETKSSSVDISVSSINSKTGSYATTGSNTFFGTQTYSGSVYIANDLIVQGSSSIQYISASSVSIGTNIVQLNTANPSVRFAGLSVQDSGSSAGVTGSMLWDSLCNRWIYSNPSTIGYSGGMLMSGPRASTLGSETPLTCNYIAKSGGGDHLYDSCIIDDGTTVCINANLKGSGQICSLMGNFGCIGIGTQTPLNKFDVIINSSNSGVSTSGISISDGAANRTLLFMGVNTGNYTYIQSNQDNVASKSLILNGSGGNVGINVTTPCAKLHVATSAITDGIFLGRSSACSNKQAIFIAADDVVGAYIAGGTNPDGTNTQCDGSGRIILEGSTTEGLQFQTSLTSAGASQNWCTRLSIKNNGNIIASTSISSPYYSFTGAIPSSAACTGYIDYSGATTRFFSVGTSGATKGAFSFLAKGADDSSTTPLSINSTGAATFSSNGANLAIFKTNNVTDSYNSGIILAGNANATQASRSAYMLLDPNGANGTGVDYGFFTALGTGETQIGTSKSDGFLALYTADSERMRITSAGRVAIGRNAPGTALSVAGQSEQWQLALSTDTGSGAVIGSPSANVLAFGDWSGNEKMRISGNGVVSINPGAAFNFGSYQTAGSTTGLSVSNGIPRNSTNNTANHVTWIGSCDAAYPVGVVIGFRSHTTDYTCRFPYFIGTQIGQTPSHLALNPDGGSVANIFIHTYTADSAGWTFVGSSPGYGITKRSGTGSQTHISFQNDNGQVGYISTSGTSTTFSTNGSDIRCKNNFETWNENASSLFTDILPMKFNYIVECEGIQKTKGFIAQCMVDKFPEAYPTNECGTYSFNPSGMVVYLMKAVQEQQCTINLLKSCIGIV